jgi:hypothetical protein
MTIRRDDDREYIVTNWHVVSGRDANTGELLDKKTGKFWRSTFALKRCGGQLSREDGSAKAGAGYGDRTQLTRVF